MKRRDFLRGAMGVAAAGVAGQCSALGLWDDLLGKRFSSPPNIVFLLADDQRADMLGCMGNRLIHTPNIDALASGGTVFENMFVTTSICCASRASILLGQYGRRHGLHQFDQNLSSAQLDEAYPMVMRKAGYYTGFVGKFGVGTKVPESYFDFCWAFADQGNYRPQSGDRHITARMGDRALEFLEGCPGDQPFCLSVSFKAPHAQDGDPDPYPFDAQQAELYNDVTIPAPLSGTEADYEALPDFLKHTEGRSRWQTRFSSPELYQRNIKNCYRLVSGVDRVVGRIRQKLAQKKMSDNTIIIYTGDNGILVGERGLAGKWYMYEESIRVPLVIYDPRLPREDRGKRIKAMALNIDLAPTMLDMAGLTPPPATQGQSLKKFVEGPAPRQWRSEFFYEHLFKEDNINIPRSEGVRTSRWKYIRWIDTDPATEQLFDLTADPREKHDLAGDPLYRLTLEEMRNRWGRYDQQLS